MDVKPKRITEVQLQVSSPIKESFRIYCKEQEVNMKDGLNEILNFITKNKIGLGELEHLMDRNLTKEVMRYHNYTVGFLKEFEKNQLEVMERLLSIVSNNGRNGGEIVKVFLQEILVNQQYMLMQSPNKKEVAQMIERNNTNIKKTLGDH